MRISDWSQTCALPIFCSQNLSTYPKAIKIVGPMLHHFDALVPVTPSSICASNVIAFNMRKLALDGVRVPFSHFIEKRAGRCPKPMGGNFRLVITQSAQCGVQGDRKSTRLNSSP